MWLNWVVLTGWNVGCLPLALILGAMKVRQRVQKALLPETQAKGKGGATHADEETGLSDLGDVALMGA